MKNIAKLLTVFTAGGLVYGLLEIICRGHTYISMGFVGGVCMVMIHLLNDERRKQLPLFLVLLISDLFIVASELLSGEILNRALGMQIWSYKSVPFNYDGQICLEYSLAWYLLSLVGVLFDEWIRSHIFKEKPLAVFSMFHKQKA
ncbi:MAG: hypothetical protein IKH90_00990 [Ruminococcus sp.]|nr:hypothetical protein [Ruminococcus sp.]